MKPVTIDSIGMVIPGAGDAGAALGLIYTETRQNDELPRVSAQPLALAGAKTPLPDHLTGVDRLLALAKGPLWESIDAELASAPIGLVVCAPAETDEPALAADADAFLAKLAGETEIRLAPQASRMFAAGRNAIFDALPFAIAAVAQPDVAAVCLLGVDSLVTKPRVKAALERGQTLGTGTPIPGEAAAAVVLTNRAREGALATIAGLGMAQEPSAVRPGQPNLGKGLLAAIEHAVADAQSKQPRFAGLVHDTAGTPADVEELAWAKTGSVFATSARMQIIFPGVSTGDAGAAMGVLALATGAFLADQGAWTDPGLCCLSAGANRVAVALAPIPAARR